MAERAWWVWALQFAIWCVVFVAAMRWLAQSRERRREAADRTMYLPASVLVIGVAALGLFTALTVLSNLDPGIDNQGRHLTEQNPAVTLTFAGFSLLGAIVVYDYFVEHHSFDEAALSFNTLTRRGVVAWDDIASIGYSDAAKWFRLVAADGRVIRISVMLTGVQEFARMVLQRVPTARIEPQARTLLENSARGELPSVWR